MRGFESQHDLLVLFLVYEKMSKVLDSRDKVRGEGRAPEITVTKSALTEWLSGLSFTKKDMMIVNLPRVAIYELRLDEG